MIHFWNSEQNTIGQFSLKNYMNNMEGAKDWRVPKLSRASVSLWDCGESCGAGLHQKPSF